MDPKAEFQRRIDTPQEKRKPQRKGDLEIYNLSSQIFHFRGSLRKLARDLNHGMEWARGKMTDG